MANREELLIIRAARAGQASAQLRLGRRYLFGGTGLPKSLPTALYWLDRAAQQNEADAWMLIGSHVPFETAQQTAQPAKLCVWYERAFDAGIAQAGLVLARLVLAQAGGAVSEVMRAKALRALLVAAHAGIADAQWMLAQWMGRAGAALLSDWPVDAAAQITDNEAMREWATRAARSGIVEAQYALAEHAWVDGDPAVFMQWALPLARHLVARPPAAGQIASARDVSIALRCAQMLFRSGHFDGAELTRLLEFAAQNGNREAQLALGLWLARMDTRGMRIAPGYGLANYKKAIRWLLMAADQGMAEASYALSCIYQKPQYAQRNRDDAQRYLERAAQGGFGPAQMTLGAGLWRTRREREGNDVRALVWLQKAHANGMADAGRLLGKIAARAAPAPWAVALLPRLAQEFGELRGELHSKPHGKPHADLRRLLAARIRLAARFGLSRAEALLLDPNVAHRTHCLVVDVRERHSHSRRRLILVQTADERRELTRIAALFEGLDCSAKGPEGNYRQRLYRLKTFLAE